MNDITKQYHAKAIEYCKEHNIENEMIQYWDFDANDYLDVLLVQDTKHWEVYEYLAKNFDRNFFLVKPLSYKEFLLESTQIYLLNKESEQTEEYDSKHTANISKL